MVVVISVDRFCGSGWEGVEQIYTCNYSFSYSAVNKCPPKIVDGGVSTMVPQGDSANCAIWLVGVTMWLTNFHLEQFGEVGGVREDCLGD